MFPKSSDILLSNVKLFNFISRVFLCMDFFRFSDPLCIANDGYGYIYFPSKCVQNIPSIFVGVSIWYIRTSLHLPK